MVVTRDIDDFPLFDSFKILQAAVVVQQPSLCTLVADRARKILERFPVYFESKQIFFENQINRLKVGWRKLQSSK